MHSIYEMKFRRRFSINPYKSLRMKLGEMSCHKDWVNDRRGDPYPVTYTNEQEGWEISESLPAARYRAENHTDRTLYKARLLGQHFPYATYEITLDRLNTSEKSGMGVQIFASGESGSDYDHETEPCLRIWAGVQDGRISIMKDVRIGGEIESEETVETGEVFEEGTALVVTSRGMFFDVYLRRGAAFRTVCTFAVPGMKEILRYDTFTRATGSLFVRLAPGDSVQGGAEFFLEGGVSHADIKCMRYENGMPIMSEGKLFLTLSARLGAGNFHAVVSWNPSTADLKMEGAIFFDYGDGYWCSDVSSSTVYNRKTGQWYVWAASFSHGHVLCHAVSHADLRYGIHVLDAETMPVQQREQETGADSLATTTGGFAMGKATLTDDTLFFGKSGDEDPDLVYDEKRGKWLLGICRLVEEDGDQFYRYFLYESDDPFTGFTFVDKTLVGSATGGSVIRVGGELYLLSGSSFGVRARYQLHPLNDLSKFTLMEFDYDDGGFRGWGQLIPVPCGRRTRYVWMTFDRHNGSDYNWSYGNLYVFEADKMNDGWEWTDSVKP